MTPDELDVMERMWANGKSVVAIAREMNCSQGTVRSIAHRHRDRFPRRYNGNIHARHACRSCFLYCESPWGKPYPCDLSMREWAEAHRYDPGDALGYVWEEEQC